MCRHADCAQYLLGQGADAFAVDKAQRRSAVLQQSRSFITSYLEVSLRTVYLGLLLLQSECLA